MAKTTPRRGYEQTPTYRALIEWSSVGQPIPLPLYSLTPFPRSVSCLWMINRGSCQSLSIVYLVLYYTVMTRADTVERISISSQEHFIHHLQIVFYGTGYMLVILLKLISQ